jgi:2-oxoglutarate ferredoxin oxidoreductase subunit gamma
MSSRLQIGGSGGQGIMLMGQLLGFAAYLGGSNVTFFPTYGPQQRGGTSGCRIVFSEEDIYEIKPDIVDCFIAMNEDALNKYLPRLRKDGVLILNTSQISDAPNMVYKVIAIDADCIAEQAGNARAANMVMLGAYIAVTGMVNSEDLILAMQKKIPGKEEYWESNTAAILTGMKEVNP